MAPELLSKSKQGGIEMPLVKVIRHGQITLPAEFRKALDLDEGDYLEAEIDQDRIVLKPKIILDRKEAIKKLHELMDRVQARNAEFSEEEVERDVLEAIQAVRRREHHA
jgi:AbrB family looped-hinge helix DNA binding protein